MKNKTQADRKKCWIKVVEEKTACKRIAEKALSVK